MPSARRRVRFRCAARFSKIFGYLFNLHYGLDRASLQGLELFSRLAKRLGISKYPDKFEFFNPEESKEK